MKNQHGLNEEKNHIGKKIFSQLSACEVTRVVGLNTNCWYRFSWKPISTYMSLTLARLCGELRLVSENYEARSGKYEAWILIFHILAADYFNRGISQFWLKYKARIAIFCKLAAIDRFSQISWKVESRWGKLESRWRNRKAVEKN
jgi:hypothetical protein